MCSARNEKATDAEPGVNLVYDTPMDDPRARLIAFAERDDNIRAMLLAGSRADPHGTVDLWSDYDVAFVTRSNEPYLRAEWFQECAAQFGELAVGPASVCAHADVELTYRRRESTSSV
jgi:hypothetical protein